MWWAPCIRAAQLNLISAINSDHPFYLYNMLWLCHFKLYRNYNYWLYPLRLPHSEFCFLFRGYHTVGFSLSRLSHSEGFSSFEAIALCSFISLSRLSHCVFFVSLLRLSHCVGSDTSLALPTDVCHQRHFRNNSRRWNASDGRRILSDERCGRTGCHGRFHLVHQHWRWFPCHPEDAWYVQETGSVVLFVIMWCHQNSMWIFQRIMSFISDFTYILTIDWLLLLLVKFVPHTEMRHE